MIKNIDNKDKKEAKIIDNNETIKNRLDTEKKTTSNNKELIIIDKENSIILDNNKAPIIIR